jgi:hypothetical protein
LLDATADIKLSFEKEFVMKLAMVTFPSLRSRQQSTMRTMIKANPSRTLRSFVSRFAALALLPLATTLSADRATGQSNLASTGDATARRWPKRPLTVAI